MTSSLLLVMLFHTFQNTWIEVFPAPAGDQAIAQWSFNALLAVVLLTCALTWVVLVPIALESHGWLPFSVPSLAVLVAAWGPLIAAVIVVASLGGRRGVRAYFGRLLIWRVHPAWYALVLVG